MRGLSPRVRGILRSLAYITSKVRSIPACTGNPAYWLARLQCQRVYPRVYGESCLSAAPEPGSRGLSPRVRGIRHGE